jgi:DNA-binding XRE family transcriptional regulator
MVGSRPRRGAHRVAYEFGVGPIPDGLFVLHECDNPKCCNPAHLRVGTQAENIRQCVERGRKHVSSIRATSKLTHEKAAQIRSLYATGNYTQEQLAKLFGVTGERIHAVIHGRAWKAPA